MRATDSGGRGRAFCYVCRKAQVTCVCATVPRVENRTRVVIVQHPRERRHPFGTARFAQLGLTKLDLHVADGGGPRRLSIDVAPPEGCGILYPSDDARILSELAVGARPSALLVLDGTWSTAAKLYQDNPWMHGLPRFRLTPAAPGNYRIRKEPRAECLSTIESIVQALQILEPGTPKLKGLLGAFDAMVDRQIARGSVPHARHRKRKRRRPLRDRVARCYVEHPESIVLLYTEARHPEQGPRRTPQLVAVVALRPATGEVFEAYLRQGFSDEQLSHLDVPADKLAQAMDTPTLAQRWRRFLGPDAALVAWNKSSLDRLALATGVDVPGEVFKGIYGDIDGSRQGGLEAAARRHSLLPLPVPLPGRPGRRLGTLAALYAEFRQRLGEAPSAGHPQPSVALG